MLLTKPAYEHVLAECVGKILASVFYYEIRYQDATPNYLLHAEIGHFLDFGLDMIMSDGSALGLIWGDEFAQYGVSARWSSLSSGLPESRVWNASSELGWLSKIGCRITSIKSFWEPFSYGDGSEARLYPQDLQLGFSDDSTLFVSAAQYDPQGNRLLTMSDDIAVIFDERVARRFGLGPFAANCSQS